MWKNLFSVPIFHGKLDNWKKYRRDLLPVCHEVRKETEDMSELPWNCHVWSTYAYDKRLYKRKEFQEISKAISVYVRSYLDRRKWKRQDKIVMTELWVNYQDKYQFQEYHDHKERVLSGIFYLEVPDNAPGLIIQNPQKANFDDLFFFQEEVQDVNEIDVETGDLIMFPGWLDHGVNANMTDKPRINIAFNFGIPKVVDAFS
jgi:uncharacterized protein (TIGR02466 family)